MRAPMPAHSERVTVADETARVWRTELGWNLLQGPYQLDLENVEREGVPWQTIHFSMASAGWGCGRRAVNLPGHLDRAGFLQFAEGFLPKLRGSDAPPEIHKLNSEYPPV